jgi:hypothetical protein
MEYNESDFMEIDSLGLVPQSDGWFLDTHTGHRISPEGEEYDKEGELVTQDDDYDR